MTGVSLGWFDTSLFNHDIAYLTKRLRKAFPVSSRSWPLRVSSVLDGGRNTGVAYAIVDGHIPIHIDQDDKGRDGRIFQFILEVENRPTLLAAPAVEENTPLVLGLNRKVMSVGMGAIEMQPGVAIHFDITTHFHGVTQFPVPFRSHKTLDLPKAVIIQVSGFPADDIAGAIELARDVVRRDRAAWDRPLNTPFRKGEAN